MFIKKDVMLIRAKNISNSFIETNIIEATVSIDKTKEIRNKFHDDFEAIICNIFLENNSLVFKDANKNILEKALIKRRSCLISRL